MGPPMTEDWTLGWTSYLPLVSEDSTCTSASENINVAPGIGEPPTDGPMWLAPTQNL